MTVTADALPVVSTRALPGSRSGDDVDPVTTEVVRQSLNAVADQMKTTLCRTAVSPVIYEMIDFACGLFDPDVRLLAQARALPQFLGTLAFCVNGVLAEIGGPSELRPGDVLWSTDGFPNGSHPQDAVIIIPIFHLDALAGYSVVKAHHLDIAAKSVYATDTTDVFQEGVVFPGVRLYAAGERQEDMWRTVMANTRAPEALASDLDAQIACARTGEQGLIRLLERHGPEELSVAIAHMFDHGETTTRRFLQDIPDGRYTAESWMDNNGIEAGRVPFSVSVEVNGSDVVVDFTDAPPVQIGPINCPLPTTVSTARLAIFGLVEGAELPNEGHFRPIEIRTRPGTMFHPLPTAPIFMYGWPADNATEAIHRALADALPGSIPAGSGGDLCGVMFWGRDAAGKTWITGMDHAVGHGATRGSDAGGPLIIISCSGIRTTPSELIEALFPLMVEQADFAIDSSGPGQYRGGPGMELRYRLLSDVKLINTCERTTLPGWGLHGGRPGRPNSVRVRLPTGEARDLTKVTDLTLPAGSMVEVSCGGGGGYGDPRDRNPAAVWADVENGYISAAAAERDYPHATRPRPQ